MGAARLWSRQRPSDGSYLSGRGHLAGCGPGGPGDSGSADPVSGALSVPVSGCSKGSLKPPPKSSPVRFRFRAGPDSERAAEGRDEVVRGHSYGNRGAEKHGC
jgi:hypothetical protein